MNIKAIEEAKTAKRWVYGTKVKKWFLVDNTDRDFTSGIAQKTFKEINTVKALEMYLSPIAF